MRKDKINKIILLILGAIDIWLLFLVYLSLKSLLPVLIGIFVFGVVDYLLYILMTSSRSENSLTEKTSQQTQSAFPNVSIVMRDNEQSCNANAIKIQEFVDNMPSNVCSQTVFLWFTNKCHTTNDAMSKDFYPEYFSTNYNISDPVKYYKDFFESGFYERAGIKEVLGNYKVTELKIIPDSIGERKGGNKEQLIQRIIENASSDMVNNILSSSNLYTLSPKGQQFLNEHIEYVHLHKKQSAWNISFSEYERAKKALGDSSHTFRDVAWLVFNTQLQELNKHKDFSRISSIYLSMAQLLFEFDQNCKRGTFFLLEALYCEVNGISYYFNIKDYHDGYITKKNCTNLTLKYI